MKILDGLIRKYSEIQIDKTNATIKIFLCNCIFYLTLVTICIQNETGLLFYKSYVFFLQQHYPLLDTQFPLYILL